MRRGIKLSLTRVSALGLGARGAGLGLLRHREGVQGWRAEGRISGAVGIVLGCTAIKALTIDGNYSYLAEK
jgi:hypothetical protein